MPFPSVSTSDDTRASDSVSAMKLKTVPINEQPWDLNTGMTPLRTASPGLFSGRGTGTHAYTGDSTKTESPGFRIALTACRYDQRDENSASRTAYLVYNVLRSRPDTWSPPFSTFPPMCEFLQTPDPLQKAGHSGGRSILESGYQLLLIDSQDL